jgi:hypothetical protein
MKADMAALMLFRVAMGRTGCSTPAMWELFQNSAKRNALSQHWRDAGEDLSTLELELTWTREARQETASDCEFLNREGLLPHYKRNVKAVGALIQRRVAE